MDCDTDDGIIPDAPDPEHLLAEQFSLLQDRDTAAPDVLLRRANLENLINQLSPWELVHLKKLVRGKVPQLADFSSLPTEIVTMIASQVDLKDVVACVQVSKQWREMWTCPDVAAHHIKTQFPGLAEMHPEAPAWPLFQKTAAKTFTRQRGNYAASLVVPMDRTPSVGHYPFTLDPRYEEYVAAREDESGPGEPRFLPSNSRSAPYMYSHGRVAWHMDAYSLFVDDLRAMTRTFVAPADLVLRGERNFVLWSMTEKLIVMVDPLIRTMIVYHLELGQSRRVTLPSQPVTTRADNETVVISFATEDPFRVPHVWRWTGGLVKLRFPEGFASWPENDPDQFTLSSAFIFHPQKSGLLYFITIRMGKVPTEYSYLDEDDFEPGSERYGYGVLVSVHKFENLRYKESFRYLLRTSERSPYVDNICRPSTSYGLYNLVLVCPKPKDEMRVAQVDFNVVTEQFSAKQYCLGGRRRPLWDMEEAIVRTRRVWDDQVYYVQNNHVAKLYGPRFSTVLVRKKRTHSGGELQPHDETIAVAGQSATHFMDDDDDAISPFTGTITKLEMDDDFVIAFHDDGYVVRSFADPAPREGSWRRNTLSSARTRFTDADTACPVLHFWDLQAFQAARESNSYPLAEDCPVCGDSIAIDADIDID